jgi:hypothetical protein
MGIANAKSKNYHDRAGLHPISEARQLVTVIQIANRLPSLFAERG